MGDRIENEGSAHFESIILRQDNARARGNVGSEVGPGPGTTYDFRPSFFGTKYTERIQVSCMWFGLRMDSISNKERRFLID